MEAADEKLEAGSIGRSESNLESNDPPPLLGEDQVLLFGLVPQVFPRGQTRQDDLD